MKQYVQYGCGLSAPKEWINFDFSPTLRIQKIPLLGNIGLKLLKKTNNRFPANVKYGDITKGLPIQENSCDGVYCSHVLEHMAYEDFKITIKNTYTILKPGGIFRLVMPDLKILVNEYLTSTKNGDMEAAIKFMERTDMALKTRPKGIKSLLAAAYGGSGHRWLWDKNSAIVELEKIGFKNIREFKFNDCEDEMFKLVENVNMFENALSLEMTK